MAISAVMPIFSRGTRGSAGWGSPSPADLDGLGPVGGRQMESPRLEECERLTGEARQVVPDGLEAEGSA